MASQDQLKIAVIVGSSREGRFSIKAAEWISSHVKKRKDLKLELIDLAEASLPFFDQPVSPAFSQELPAYKQVQKFQSQIDQADGYIVITPEYNHGPSAVLKNALDWVYRQWAQKPIGFVSYGSVGGARAVEQLRLVAVELQMAPIREAVHFLGNDFFSSLGDEAKLKDMFAKYDHSGERMIDQLTWWAQALKTARK